MKYILALLLFAACSPKVFPTKEASFQWQYNRAKTMAAHSRLQIYKTQMLQYQDSLHKHKN